MIFGDVYYIYLYLFSQFFEDKAIKKLLGTGINSEYSNDDKIDRICN